jgi:hypothetical protein
MRCGRGLLNAFLVVIAVTLPGCLSLGGKTVYSNESPETTDRLTALEKRVNILEQAVTGRATMPAPSTHPVP